jgi:N-acetylmuramic acid 6-phosphate etherase
MKAMSRAAAVFLGIEGGGTQTIAIAAGEDFQEPRTAKFGPANIKLMDDAQLENRLREVALFCAVPTAIGIGLAGARDEHDRARIRRAAERAWPGAPCVVTHDLELAWRAAEDRPGEAARVLVLSGTGSCCYGRSAAGAEAKLGGWGHLLGDQGSGFDIGISGAKRAVWEYDRHGRWTALGESLLRHLLLNRPDDLIGWIQDAEKSAVAGLAVPVFAAAARRDKLALEVLGSAAESLAADAVLCARRLTKTGDSVSFVLAGSVLLKQPTFATKVAREIKAAWPGATVEPLKREGAWGAVKLAMATPPARLSPRRGGSASRSAYVPTFTPDESPTEQRNPKSRNFDKLSTTAAIRLMLVEEESVAAALRLEMKEIERAVGLCARALKRGGRIFYAGAGTSGRLGVLDASECPPTFRASPEMVQGIIAGGHRALWQAVEGAEDDAGAGAESVRFRGVGASDVLFGIAASGRTPFVWGALGAARAARAKTVLLHFNPSLKIKRTERPNVVIAPNLGPEVLTGSTRLKCGTATKLVLNLVSTVSMVRLGKVVGNLMVDLHPSNVKLRDRAARIVQELTGRDLAMARSVLEEHGWIIKNALRALERNPPAVRRQAKTTSPLPCQKG